MSETSAASAAGATSPRSAARATERLPAPLLVTLGFASLFLGALASEVSPRRLFDRDGVANALALLRGFLRPDLSAEFVARIGALAVESLLIGVAGMGLALLVGIPLALLAADLPRLPHDGTRGRLAHVAAGVVRAAARLLLAVFRAVPEIVWAFLFVRILGLGPGPAVLALGVGFGGILGKLYAELLEAVDPEPVHALLAAGSSRWATLLYAALPQVKSQWIGYGLFRLECAIRSGAILGVVGAGGLGSEIELSIRYFQFDKLATALMAVLAYVAAVEAASRRVKRAHLAYSLLLVAAGTAAAALRLDIAWKELVAREAGQRIVDFLAGFASLTLEPAFVSNAARLTLETLGIAWFGTFLAGALAFVLAPVATRPLAVSGYREDALRGRGESRAAWWCAHVCTRALLQFVRSFPELVWALLFVVWVGPGPFAGALAIAAHTVGILGRLFGEVYDDVEPGPAGALEAAGARRIGIWAYGILPLVGPRLLAYALYRFEVNVRATAMVGFVGAGGLGNALHTSISLFHTRDLATLILVLFATVALVDAAGDRLRHRLLRGERS